MATVKLILERGRASRDGMSSLVFQVIHQRVRKVIYTPFKIQPHEFDEDSEMVLHISEDIRRKRDVFLINRNVKKQRRIIDNAIKKLGKKNCSFTIADISYHYRLGNNSVSLIDYIDLQIERKHAMSKFGTEEAYRNTRASLDRFTNSRITRIMDVNFTFVREYEEYLIIRGVSANTICFYLRNLKSVYNQAISDGYSLPETSPFKYVQTRMEKTVKRALNKEGLQLIKNIDLSYNRSLEQSRDLFLFSFYARGMAIVDIIYLTHDDIKGGVIVYKRHKTNQRIEVFITDELKKMIAKYKNDGKYVFPLLIGGCDSKELYRIYRLTLERTNRQLKMIGKLLDLDTPLTTYVSRHSWATQAKQCGAPISVISEGLGHTSEKTTQIYLKAFDRSIIDKVNQDVTNSLRLK